MWSNDPASYGGGSVATGSVSDARDRSNAMTLVLHVGGWAYDTPHPVKETFKLRKPQRDSLNETGKRKTTWV